MFLPTYPLLSSPARRRWVGCGGGGGGGGGGGVVFSCCQDFVLLDFALSLSHTLQSGVHG